jgi:2-dehydro-3-deoxygluconokinase
MYDLVTLGEVLLRLAIPSPGRFENARQLDIQLGGAEANVAAACARLGLKVAWISAVPDSPWGQRVRRDLAGHGVDCAHVRTLPGTRLGLYFLEYGVAPRPVHVLYDRRDSAFSRLTVDAVDWDAIRSARIVHITGITPALSATARAVTDRVFDEAASVSFDVNYRAALWTPGEARTFAESILSRVRYLFLGRTEAKTVFDLEGAGEAVLDILARRAPKATIALLQGQEGSTVFAEGRLWRPSVRHTVHMVDPIGAGDAYVAGYLATILRGRGPQDAVDVAATVAALKCSIWGDIALISLRDVEEALAGGPDVRR